MGRPRLCRRVSRMPSTTYFKPAGVPLSELKEVCISVEEVEAVRLKDIEALEQEICAGEMNVSRPTFVRILDSARKKMAEALIQGKAIRIEGGNYEMAIRRFQCRNSHEWEIPCETLKDAALQRCPTCNTDDIASVQLPPERPGYRKRFRRGKIRQEDNC